MSITDARKLKPGDTVRLKTSGHVFIVTGREDSGRVVYGRIHGGKHGDGSVITVNHTDIRLPVRGQ